MELPHKMSWLLMVWFLLVWREMAFLFYFQRHRELALALACAIQGLSNNWPTNLNEHSFYSDVLVAFGWFRHIFRVNFAYMNCYFYLSHPLYRTHVLPRDPVPSPPPFSPLEHIWHVSFSLKTYLSRLI